MTGVRTRRRGLSGVRAILHEFSGRADRTSLPRRIGPARRLAVVEESLEDLSRVGHALGATVNDVLLAAVAGGMRTLLAARGGLRPGMVLRASVPVGRAGAGQTAGMLAVALPVGEDDPVARVTAISRDTAAAKTRLAGGGGHVMDVLDLPVPLARLVVRFMRRIAGRRINLFVTDVPGPSEPLWLDGARLERAVPVAPLVQGVPLGVAALSYAGRLAIAVNADAAVTDLERFAVGMRADFASMRRSAGVQGPPAAYEAPLTTGRT
jgi:WS/DGAT/MGAT family acyltransferase